MEPMALGSPVGSPNSPPVANSPFLPSFLMGERDQGPNQAMPMSNKSPSRLARHISFSTPPIQTHNNPQCSSTPVFGSVQQGTQGSMPRPERVTGPPTRGLFDEPPGVQFDSSVYTHPNTSAFSVDATLPTPVEDSANCWVTVFGFPPAATSLVLAQFGAYGHVVETRSSGKGNWVHVKYHARSDARRALSYNAKVFGDSIMIGVVPCRDQHIIGPDSQHKENLSLNQHDTPRPAYNAFVQDTSFRSPGFPGTPGSQGSFSVTSPMRPALSNARPLGQAYRNAQHDSEVVMSRNIPQKSTSMVTKAWEFLGW